MAKTKREVEGANADQIAPPIDPTVEVRVLKRGADKISTGTHDARGGDLLFEQGESFVVAKSIADVLEDLGYVEIGKPKKAGKPVPLTTGEAPAVVAAPVEPEPVAEVDETVP